MKRCLTSLTLILLGLLRSQASLLVSDAFDYPNGNLVGAAGSPWLAHNSAGLVAVAVNAGRAIIAGGTGTREDISLLIPGQPFLPGGATTALYASFVMNCSVLPNVVGTHFAHFQSSTNFFRARIWASTTNAAPGTFRLSVGNSPSAKAGNGQLASDLLPSTNYRVVLRYNVAAGTTTLWINPASEGSPGVAADDIPSVTQIERFGFRQGLEGTDGSSGTMAVDSLLVGTQFSDVQVADEPPSISSISNQQIVANNSTGPLNFTVGDDQTPLANLTLTRNSGNLTLVPLNNIVFGGAGANRTVTVTPAANLTGTANITITVSDGANQTPTSFQLTIIDNQPPTISAITNKQVVVNGNTGPLGFTVSDNLVPAANLTLTRNSDNLTLVPLNSIVFGGSGANRTVTVTPVGGQPGTARITVSVSDGSNVTPTSFQVTVVNDLPPTITGIAGQPLFVNASTGPLNFTIGDDLTALASLTLTPGSDNLTLVPLNGIVFSGAGAGRTVTVTPALNKVGTANITVTVGDGTNSTPTSFQVTVTDNQPPSISAIADQTLAANGTTGPLNFTISDGVIAAASLTLGKNSDNLTLVPLNNIVFGGSGANRTVTVTPVAGQQGSAVITVTVSDGPNLAQRTFRVTVGVPAITPLVNQFTAVSTALGPMPITVSHGALDPGQLNVTAASSLIALVPQNGLVVGGSGPNRTLTMTPTAGQTGVTTITLTASDGIQSVQRTFTLTVHPYLGLLFSDDFSRPEEGSVVDNTLWWNHGGALGQTQVLLDQLQLSQTQSEDFHRRLHSTINFAPAAGHVLYASFKVNFSALPTGSGSFFAHFNTNGFRSRIFVRTNFAAANHFRLGIANATVNPPNEAFLTRDLALNQNHLVVVRYSVGTGESSLWVSPANVFAVSVAAMDTPQPSTLDTFAFRQSDPGNPLGMGVLTVDDLKVGTAFGDVVEPQPTLGFSRNGNTLRLSWPTGGGFLLRRADSLPAISWSNVPFTTGAPNDTADVNTGSGNGIFRLEK